MTRPRSRAKPQASQRRTREIWLRAIVVVIAGLIVYANSLSGPFVLDDESSIVENPAIRSLGTVMAERLNSPLAGRPIAGLSIAINFALGGLQVRGYHLTNIVIHLCCALLLLGVIRRTLTLPRTAGAFEDRAVNLGFAAALLWTLHPLNTEAVNYITERTESLMAFFYLLTLYASLRSFTAKRTAGWQLLAVAACALGMACKESMVTAPLIVLLYDAIFLYPSVNDALRANWRLYGGLAITWLLLAYVMLPGPRAGTVGFTTAVSAWSYLVNQAAMIARYFRLALWPGGLVADYGPPMPLTVGDVWPQALLIVLLVLITVAALRWRPTLGFLGAWVFIILAPTSSIVPIATEVGAERRMYLPLMAIIAFVVIGVQGSRAWGQRIPRAVWAFALAVIAIGLGATTMARNRDYASGLLLAQSVVRNRPSDAAHGFLGSELARLGRDTEAIPELRVGARVDPRARYNLGIALFNQKRFGEAIHELQGLAVEHPWREEVPSARRIAGRAFAAQRKWPEAIDEFRLTLAMTPGDAEAKALLVDALNQQGLTLADASQFAAAAAVFRRAAALDPKQALIRQNLAAALLDDRDLGAAEQEAGAAIALAPNDAGAYALLGRALALQGKMPEALAQFEHALRLAPGDPHIEEDLRRVKAASR